MQYRPRAGHGQTLQFFPVALCIMRYEGGSAAQDLRGTAIASGKPVQTGPGKVLRESQHQPAVRPPEAINALIVIPHGQEVLLPSGQHLQQLQLQRGSILIFIDHDIAELFLPMLQKSGLPPEKIPALFQYILKIQHPFPLLPPPVGLLQTVLLLLGKDGGLIRFKQFHQKLPHPLLPQVFRQDGKNCLRAADF